jgi:predicted  nucleic acid-binding Zn-ribbon protein
VLVAPSASPIIQREKLYVKARPEDQLALLTLQERDNHIAQLGHQRDHIAEQAELDALVAQLREFSQALIAANGELEDAKLELSRIEDDVRVVDGRIAKDKERENNAASAKDLQALESELATLATRKNNLEDVELVVMEKVEVAEQAVAAIVADRDVVEASRASVAVGIEEKVAGISDEITTEQGARAALVATLPADLVELYERQRSRYGIGAALLQRRISGGSGVELTSTDLDNIRLAAPDEVILCPDSSCILVRTSESGL